jgi:3-phosphoglycerate kinase
MEETLIKREVAYPVLDIEAERHRNSLQITKLNHRMEAVRLAQQVLLENTRNRPANERTVTAEEISTFAHQLISVVDV